MVETGESLGQPEPRENTLGGPVLLSNVPSLLAAEMWLIRRNGYHCRRRKCRRPVSSSRVLGLTNKGKVDYAIGHGTRLMLPPCCKREAVTGRFPIRVEYTVEVIKRVLLHAPRHTVV